jgi:DNA polymerase III subunit epsilon
MNQQTQDRNAAILWARSVLDRAHEYYILDTETTGLINPEVIELAVVDLSGKMIINQRFRPSTPIEPEATNIHGITNEMLATQPEWKVGNDCLELVIFRQKLLIYNHLFDYQAIQNSYQLHSIPFGGFSGECVMNWYSQFCGEWNSFRKSYRWQKLPGGDHSALGDCIATLEIIKRMAICGLVEVDEPIAAPISLPEAIEHDPDILRT